jgi:long-subunit acyl-CoA synthetase (AMP-forming)
VREDGELIVGRRTFLGYLGETAAPSDWATGDLAEIDSDAFIAINGRKSNVLITSYGRNVAPEWVESELLAQPEIAQAVVFGEGAAELCAVLVPSQPEAPMEQAVVRANAALPVYARVGRWRAAAPFDPERGELTRNGRPRRAALRAAHRDFIELDN